MKKFKTYDMVLIALFAAVMCIISPFSINISSLVPLSLATLIVMLSAVIIGAKRGTMSVIIYILLGAFGLPVFSGGSGGIAKLMGPTGGYIIGYIFLAIISGYVYEKTNGNKLMSVFGMVIGTAVLYVFGTAWFIFLTKSELLYSLTICVFPFIAGDFIKIIVALFVGDAVRKTLIKASVLKEKE